MAGYVIYRPIVGFRTVIYQADDTVTVVEDSISTTVVVPSSLLTPTLSTVHLFKTSVSTIGCYSTWQSNLPWVVSLLVKDNKLLPFWDINGEIVLWKPLEIFTNVTLAADELRYVNVPTGKPCFARLDFYLGMCDGQAAADFLKVRIQHGLSTYTTAPENSLAVGGAPDFTLGVTAEDFNGDRYGAAPLVRTVNLLTDIQGRLQFQRQGTYHADSGSSAFLVGYRLIPYL